MSLAAAYMFGKNKVNPILQTLQNKCSFYTSLEDWNGNNFIIPEKGSGAVYRNAVNDITGIVGTGVNISQSITAGNATLNADTDALYMTDGTNDLDFAVSGWFRFTALGGTQYIFNTIASTSGFGISGIGIRMDNATSLNAAIWVNSVAKDNSFNSLNIPLNQWNHIAINITKSGTSGYELFLNGVNKPSNGNGNNRAQVARSFTNARKLRLGDYHDGRFKMIGALDEQALFKNHLLTQEQVDFLYNNGNGIQLF